MGFKHFLEEMTDQMKKKTHNLDSGLTYAMNEFKRILTALEYSNPNDVDEIIDKAYKTYQDIRKTLDKEFKDSMRK